MKKILFAAIALLTSATVFGQKTVNVNNTTNRLQVTNPAVVFPPTALKLDDPDQSNQLTITNGTNLVSNRTLTILTTGDSTVTFPTSGTLAVVGGGGLGDVVGPASATDNAIVRFDGTGGKTVQNSAVTIADTTGAMTWATGQAATLTGGDNGASLVLGSGATTGSVTVTPTNFFSIAGGVAASGHGAGRFIKAQIGGAGSNGGNVVLSTGDNGSGGANGSILFGTGAITTTAPGSIASELMRLAGTGNLLIGTTTDMASTSGGLTVAATGSGATATAVNTGGLRSANFGLSTVSGGASYFGGGIYAAASTRGTTFGDVSDSRFLDFTTVAAIRVNGAHLLWANDNTYDIGASGATRPRNIFAGGTLTTGGAATFSGAVTHTLGTYYLPQTAPASPASGWVIYTDSGDSNKLKAKASTGTVVTIGTP